MSSWREAPACPPPRKRRHDTEASWIPPLKSTAAGPWPALAAAAAVALAAGLLWQTLADREQAGLERLVAEKASSLKFALVELVEARLLALERMAARWKSRGGTPREEWETDAEVYLSQHPVFTWIGWVDPDFGLRWIVSVRESEAGKDRSPGAGEDQRVHSQKVITRGLIDFGFEINRL